MSEDAGIGEQRLDGIYHRPAPFSKSLVKNAKKEKIKYC
jgi:hypothetical protein